MGRRRCGLLCLYSFIAFGFWSLLRSALRGDVFAAFEQRQLSECTSRNSCALLYRIQTLLTVLGAMFRFSNCEKADLYARIAD
jgi:hypothetical protein